MILIPKLVGRKVAAKTKKMVKVVVAVMVGTEVNDLGVHPEVVVGYLGRSQQYYGNYSFFVGA